MTTTTKTRTSSVVRSLSDPLRLDRGETAHVGVDVHKRTYHVAVASNRRGLIARWAQPASPQVLLERLPCIRRRVAQVVDEAGPTGFTLARRLQAEGHATRVIAPSKLRGPAPAPAR